MQYITGAYQPILVLSGVVCLVGLIAWARDARADDPVVDHARRITHLRYHGTRVRARDAWQSAGSVPAAARRPSLSPVPRIAGRLSGALRLAARAVTRTAAMAGASAGSSVDSARPRVAGARAGATRAARIVASRARTEGRSLAGVAAARAAHVAARWTAAVRSAVAEPGPDGGRQTRPEQPVAAGEQVPGWLMSVRRPDASAIPFGPLSGVPAPVAAPDLESHLDRERRRLG